MLIPNRRVELRIPRNEIKMDDRFQESTRMRIETRA
jgi:hypothetical protein